MLTPIERCEELSLCPPLAIRPIHRPSTSGTGVRCCWSVAGAQHHRMTKPMT